jgi:aconitate hydratase 2/2-methylisocitrate dehydratase
MSSFLEEYQKEIQLREKEGVPPLPLNAKQTEQLIELLIKDSKDSKYLLELLENRVPPGVDEAALVKANFLLYV